MLFNSPFPLNDSITELYTHATLSGHLTLGDRYGIRNALLSGTIDEESQRCIDRLVYAVRRGRLAMD